MKSHSKFTFQLSCKMWAEKWTIMQEASGPKRPQTAPNGPKRRKENHKPKTPLLIIISITWKHEVHGNLFSPLFEKQSPWTKTS